MRVLTDEIRGMVRVGIIAAFVLLLLSLCATLWQESRPPLRLTYIKTPAYVVAGETMTITEVGEQRAGCMPSGVARYLVLPGDAPPFALVTDANPPNAVLALKAASAWRAVPAASPTAPRVARQPGPEQAQAMLKPDQPLVPVTIKVRVPVPANAPTGRVQFGEQYDFAACGALRGLLPIHTVAGAGPWMTVLPPGSTLPRTEISQ